LDLHTIISAVRTIASTQPHEITCDECMAQMDRYAELHLEGERPADSLPLVHAHLSICRDCREEYDGLLAALSAFG